MFYLPRIHQITGLKFFEKMYVQYILIEKQEIKNVPPYFNLVQFFKTRLIWW